MNISAGADQDPTKQAAIPQVWNFVFRKCCRNYFLYDIDIDMLGKLEAIMAVLYFFGINFPEIEVISIPTVCDHFKMLKISLR